jgi:hypothetical protein
LKKLPFSIRIVDVANFCGYILKLSAAWGIIVMVISQVASPYFRPYTLLPTNVDALAARVAQLTNDTTQNFDKYGRQFANLRDEIDALKVQPAIVEYDLQRSKVRGLQCRIGETCFAEFRFRRTQQGLPCSKPTAQYWVSNHFGDTRPAMDVRVNIVRADADWIIVPVQFTLPDGVLPGSGNFFARLEYRDCPWSANGALARETTPKLKFEILEIK